MCSYRRMSPPTAATAAYARLAPEPGRTWCSVLLREPVLLSCDGCLLVRHERVWWMTGHTRLAFHEWIRLQLCHLLGVAGVAYVQGRRGSDALCCDLAMAHGAFDIIGAMRAAFPLGIRHLVAARTGFPSWNRLMVLVRGMSLLGNGRLDGGSQNEKNEQDRAEQKCAESVHGQNLPSRTLQYRTGGGRRAVMQITAHCNAIYRTRRDPAHCPVVFICSRSLGPHRLIPGGGSARIVGDKSRFHK